MVDEREVWLVTGQIGFNNEAAGALFSDDRVYRYALWRIWDPREARLMFIGLNPSTADEWSDDQTIRRCIGFAKRWKYGGIVMCNLYAYKATDPRNLFDAQGPVGEYLGHGDRNDRELVSFAQTSGAVVAAWGATRGPVPWRAEYVLDMLKRHDGRDVLCLGRTKDGHPCHPSRLPSSRAFEIYEPPEALRS